MAEPMRAQMTADEIAAQISAEHDAHVDRALAAVQQIAEWLGTDGDHLIPFNQPVTMTFEMLDPSGFEDLRAASVIANHRGWTIRTEGKRGGQ